MIFLKKDPYNRPIDQDDDKLFDEQFSVASSTDCTGLIPAAPANEAEAESYGELYDIPLAKKAKDANNHMQDEDVYNTPTSKGGIWEKDDHNGQR